MKKSFVLGIALGIMVCILLMVWIHKDTGYLETSLYTMEQGIERIE